MDTRFIPLNSFNSTMNEDKKESQATNFRNEKFNSKSSIDYNNQDIDNAQGNILSHHKRKKEETVSQFHDTGISHSNEKGSAGRWTEEEHRLFVEAIQKHGKNWKMIEKMVQSRSPTQLRSHAQKFFIKIMQIYNTSDPINYIKENADSLNLVSNSSNEKVERKQTEIEDAIKMKYDTSIQDEENYLKELYLKMEDRSLNEEIYKSFLLNYLKKLLIQSSASNPSIRIFSLLLKSKIFVYEQLKNQNLSIDLRKFFSCLYSDLQTKLYIMKKDLLPFVNSLYSNSCYKKSKISLFSSSFQINDPFRAFKLKQYFS